MDPREQVPELDLNKMIGLVWRPANDGFPSEILAIQGDTEYHLPIYKLRETRSSGVNSLDDALNAVIHEIEVTRKRLKWLQGWDAALRFGVNVEDPIEYEAWDEPEAHDFSYPVYRSGT